MASLPVANSAAQMPRALIMAMRPLLISLARISSVYIFKPKGSPKLPGSLASLSRHANSRRPQATKRMTPPSTPSPVFMAPKVPRTPSKPGTLRKCCPMAPMEAIMATRPCFNSAARKSRKPASSPTSQRLSGSKYPMGSSAPICSEGWKGGGGGGASASTATVAARAAPSRATGRAAVDPAKPEAVTALQACLGAPPSADKPN
mmetsp:Transcript_136569/g.424306  ORF Transcript_136569/g.424306 Transcript_136569/m.424306 type:complete len:204 (-) Transcript_136569:369-980(-)